MPFDMIRSYLLTHVDYIHAESTGGRYSGALLGAWTIFVVVAGPKTVIIIGLVTGEQALFGCIAV